MEKRNWFVDINSFEPMINGATAIVREDKNNNNGTNDGLMIIGLNEVNANISGGLSFKDAYLISACPDMLQSLTDILTIGLTDDTILAANKAIKKAYGIFGHSTPSPTAETPQNTGGNKGVGVGE